jgi:hypothetical protein
MRRILLEEVILSSPTQGFITLPEIINRVGHNLSSIPPTVMRAVRKELLERQNPRHFTPQGYRLSDKGRNLRYRLESMGNG